MMARNAPLLKRTYDAVALFSLMNIAAIVGVLAYLLGTGALDGPTLKRMAEAARKPAETQEAEPTGQQKPADAETKEADMDRVGASQTELEIMQREADRIKEELRQRLALNNSILLRVTTERKAFQEEREAAERQDMRAEEMRESEGFAKQVAILEAMKPSVAVDYLLRMNAPDDAARILLEMETRRARKIVEAARRPKQVEQMRDILLRIREVAPERSGGIEGETD